MLCLEYIIALEQLFQLSNYEFQFSTEMPFECLNHSVRGRPFPQFLTSFLQLNCLSRFLIDSLYYTTTY